MAERPVVVPKSSLNSSQGAHGMKCEAKVMVNIPNWDKYQKKMTRRSRDWIAMSTEMLSDPCVRELPAEAFKCWVGLLLHAGKVGVPFKFSASSARVLFGLKHSSGMELLQNQGLITLTVHDITVQDITRHNYGASNAPAQMPEEKPEEKHPPLLDNEWAEIRKIYPARKGGQRWPEAEQAAKAHVKRGTITARELYRAVQTYARHCQNTAKTGTEIVMQAGTFFGSGKRFLDEYSDGHEPSRGKAPAPSHFGSDF